jgi:hypothetical protein
LFLFVFCGLWIAISLYYSRIITVIITTTTTITIIIIIIITSIVSALAINPVRFNTTSEGCREGVFSRKHATINKADSRMSGVYKILREIQHVFFRCPASYACCWT